MIFWNPSRKCNTMTFSPRSTISTPSWNDTCTLSHATRQFPSRIAKMKLNEFWKFRATVSSADTTKSLIRVKVVAKDENPPPSLSHNVPMFAMKIRIYSPMKRNTAPTVSAIGDMYTCMRETTSCTACSKERIMSLKPPPMPARFPRSMFLRSPSTSDAVLLMASIVETFPPAVSNARAKSSAPADASPKIFTISGAFFPPKYSDAILSRSVSLPAPAKASLNSSNPARASTPSALNFARAIFSPERALSACTPFFSNVPKKDIDSVALMPKAESVVCEDERSPVSFCTETPVAWPVIANWSRSPPASSSSMFHFAMTSATAFTLPAVSCPVTFANCENLSVSSCAISPDTAKRVLRFAIVSAITATSSPTPFRSDCRTSSSSSLKASPVAPVPLTSTARALLNCSPTSLIIAPIPTIAPATSPLEPKCDANLSRSSPKSERIELPLL